MKGVMLEVPNFVLEWRRKTGADRFDEMWEGVLHMNPPPNVDHQDLEAALIAWLDRRWKRPVRRFLHQVAVSPDVNWVDNYRVPDLILLLEQDLHLLHSTHFQGAPTVVVEIRSPGDESYEKLPFYAASGVPEVWIIDRDTREPELLCLHDGEYRSQSSDEAGWLSSETVGIELRGEAGNKLGIRLAGDDASHASLPQ